MKLSDLFESKPETFANLLRRRCSPFLEQCGDELLVRGIPPKDLGVPRTIETEAYPSREIAYQVLKVRKDRFPVSTPEYAHVIIDQWFRKNFGWAARSQAMFAFGESNTELAANYGYEHFVFPIGKFKFVWSPKQEDLYYEFSDMFDDGKAVPESEIISALEESEYQDTDLERAIRYGHEIMIDCDSFIAAKKSSAVEADFERSKR